MILQRINTFDGVMIIPKETRDNFLFNHCSDGKDVMGKDEAKLTNLLFLHGVTCVTIEDHSSVTELKEHQNKEVKR